jgi:hypothetical protein
MPTHIKIFVSLLTLLVGGAFYYFENLYGQPLVARVGGVLSIFMVVAMWVFPEAGGKSRK